MARLGAGGAGTRVDTAGESCGARRVQHDIRNRRLQSALRDLGNEPQRGITEIIERHGFSNERPFQRAFQARFGMIASQARAGWKSKFLFDPFDDSGF